jgi:23S rRNA pseudouridine1911/1915/1917 synthase
VTRLRGLGPQNRPPDVPEGSVVTVFRAPRESAGMRLDTFMTGELHASSRNRVQAIIRNSAHGEDGRKLRCNHRVQTDERIYLWRPPWDETPVPRDIPVIYEDEHILAVSKPSQIPVHPSARYYRNTVIVMLRAERPEGFLSLAHRIDRETSGVLLLTKTAECDRLLKKMLEERDDIEKEYLAIVWGEAPPAPLRYVKSMELDLDNPLRVKMKISDAPSAMHACTRFTRLEVRKRTDGRAYSMLRCELETGRQHQIRLHLASMGLPVVGDKLYGPDERCLARHADGEGTLADAQMLELSRHALHASCMRFKHPMTGEQLSIEAPLPDELREFWDSI